MSTFKDYNASQDPSEDNKIMHALLEADNGITFMASDGHTWDYHNQTRRPRSNPARLSAARASS